LRDSVAGSDFSYEDLAGDRSLSSRYSPKLVGSERLQDQDCYVVELTAKERGLAYPILKIWVSSWDFSALRVQKYSQNGRLLKTQEVLSFLTIKGRQVPAQIRMVDHLKGRSNTTFTIQTIEIDLDLAERRFSLEELTW
jgi:negative regulator of sigma E activity